MVVSADYPKETGLLCLLEYLLILVGAIELFDLLVCQCHVG